MSSRAETGAGLDEFALIARHFAPIAAPGGLGLTDDAAMLAPPPGSDLVLTKDMLVAGVHFFAEDPPASIARKALGVNLSDLAAKGAAPLGFLLGFGRPRDLGEAWIGDFARGLGEAAAEAGCPLFGGDTVKAPVLTLSITAFGAVPAGHLLRRQGGKPGDALFVSGTIGDAALGLKLRLEPEAGWAMALAADHRAFLLDRYLHPRPRLALVPLLRAHASAAMDISDGLVGDCDKLAAHLGRRIDIARVPLSAAARAAIALEPALLETALTGGDDYEVLFAVPAEKVSGFDEAVSRSALPVTTIGALAGESVGAVWVRQDGQPASFSQRSFRHF